MQYMYNIGILKHLKLSNLIGLESLKLETRVGVSDKYWSFFTFTFNSYFYISFPSKCFFSNLILKDFACFLVRVSEFIAFLGLLQNYDKISRETREFLF